MLSKKSRVFVFLHKILYWKFVQIYGLSPASRAFSIEKIIVTFNLRDLRDVEEPVIARAFFLFEAIVNQKVSVSRVVVGDVKKKKKFSITGKVTLRGVKLFYFFDMFNVFVQPMLRRNFFSINKKLDSFGNLSITVKDISVFPGMSELMTSVNFKYPLKVDLFFKKGSKLQTKYLLEEFGFI